MPILHKTITLTEEVFDGFQCDRCKKEFRDDLDLQEMFQWFRRGGYGSVWGDGVGVSLVLCQQCAFEVFGEHVVYDKKEEPVGKLQEDEA